MKKRKQVVRDGRPGRLEQPRAELVSRVWPSGSRRCRPTQGLFVLFLLTDAAFTKRWTRSVSFSFLKKITRPTQRAQSQWVSFGC
jgi:hypothetical protein